MIERLDSKPFPNDQANFLDGTESYIIKVISNIPRDVFISI